MTTFQSEAVLKRDLFSETHKGHMADAPETPIIRRIVTASPWWTRPLAWLLAKREIGALRAVSGIEGTPQLVSVDADGLFRLWSEGEPLHIAARRRANGTATPFGSCAACAVPASRTTISPSRRTG